MLHALRPPVDVMNLETLGIEHPPLAHHQIGTGERADLTNRDLPERLPNRKENANNHRPHGNRLFQPATELPGQSSLDSAPFHQTYRQSIAIPPVNGTRVDYPPSSPGNRLSTSQNPLQTSIEQSS
jgi:hypothetical protein